MYSQIGILRLCYFTRTRRERWEDLKSEKAQLRFCCRELVSCKQTYATLTFSHLGTELSGQMGSDQKPKKFFLKLALKIFLNWEIRLMQSSRYAQWTIARVARVARCTCSASKSCDISHFMLHYWVTLLWMSNSIIHPMSLLPAHKCFPKILPSQTFKTTQKYLQYICFNVFKKL